MLPPARYPRARQPAEPRRHVDDQRHPQPRVQQRPLAPRQAHAVVAEVHDDGVIGQPRRLELGQPVAHLRVHLRQPVVVLRPVAPHLRGVRVIGGDAYPGGVVHRLVGPLADAALVGDAEVEHREERHRPRPPVPRTVAPVRLVRRLVPHPARLLDVVVLLRVVRRVVASRAQELREHRHPVGQPHPAAHVVGTDGRRIHPGDDGGPGRRAHRRVRPRVQVDRAALGQPIQIRRVGVRVAVGPERRPVVLAAQPQDVRPRLRLRRRRPRGGSDRSSKHQRRHDCPCAHDRLHSAGRDPSHSACRRHPVQFAGILPRPGRLDFRRRTQRPDRPRCHIRRPAVQ